MTDKFMASINLFVDSAQENMEIVARKVGIKILAQLVDMSPVGNPELWKINKVASGYNRAVFEHNESLKQDPNNLTPKRKRLKKRVQVNDSMDIYSPPGYTGGRFRGNWQVTYDEPADNAIERIDADGNLTKAAGNYVLSQFKVGTKAIYFTNNVPYAYRLEMGHSTQAPNGMIRVTAQDIAKLFGEAVSEVKRS